MTACVKSAGLENVCQYHSIGLRWKEIYSTLRVRAVFFTIIKNIIG